MFLVWRYHHAQFHSFTAVNTNKYLLIVIILQHRESDIITRTRSVIINRTQEHEAGTMEQETRLGTTSRYQQREYHSRETQSGIMSTVHSSVSEL